MPTFYAPGKRYPRNPAKTNRTYVVRGTIDGRQYEIVTAALHKNGAGGAQDEWEDFKRTVRRQRGRAVTPETALFADAVDLYIKDIDPGPNERRYLKALRRQIGDTPLAETNYAVLLEAAHALYPDCKPQTKNRQALRPAGAVLHHAYDLELCPWVRIKSIRESEPERPLMYPEDLQAFVAAARRAGDKALLALLLTFQFQGWRVSETVAIERARIDWRRRTLLRWVSKSGEWRNAAVLDEVLKAWRALPARADGRLFPYKTRKDVYRAIDALALPARFRPHMARRGLATALRELGNDAAAIANAGQWKDSKSVGHYTRDDPERARAVLGQIRGRIRARQAKPRKRTGS